jgi:hypothetical protein
LLVTSILQTLCGEPHQLAQVLREGKPSHEVQITGTKNALWKAFLDTSRDLQRDGVHITPELVARLSPYLTEHIKRFGQYLVDMHAPPLPFDIQPLFVTLT